MSSTYAVLIVMSTASTHTQSTAYVVGEMAAEKMIREHKLELHTV